MNHRQNLKSCASIFFFSLTAISSLAATPAPIAGASGASTRYLVKFRSDAGVQALGTAHAFNFEQVLPQVNIGLIQIEDANELSSLKARPDVEFVEPEIIFPAPLGAGAAPEAALSTMDKSPESDISTTFTWGLAAVNAAAAWSETSQGSAGLGARVAVLDTGIDRNHPDLKDNFESGKDFTGWSWPKLARAWTLLGAPAAVVPADKDDFFDDVGHGTHVSGTVAGRQGHRGFISVAPAARLLMAKICTSSGCSSGDIVKGIDWAIAQKVDVINMSIGSSSTSDAISSALADADQAGVVAVVAAGNDNKQKLSFPAAVGTVVGVGAIDESLRRAVWNGGQGGSNYGAGLALMGPGDAVVSSVPIGTGVESHVVWSGHEITSAPMTGIPLTKKALSAPLVDVGYGQESDFEDLDLTGKIALVERGAGVKYNDKIQGAAHAHALAVVIFNNVAGITPGSALNSDGDKTDVPAVMIALNDGLTLRGRLKQGEALAVDYAAVTASYAVMSGTSMAAPHVTGVVALMRAVNGSLTPAQVRALLKSSAQRLACDQAKNECGAGLVDAAAAVHAAAASTALAPSQE